MRVTGVALAVAVLASATLPAAAVPWYKKRDEVTTTVTATSYAATETAFVTATTTVTEDIAATTTYVTD
jgi:hypothetical protein